MRNGPKLANKESSCPFFFGVLGWIGSIVEKERKRKKEYGLSVRQGSFCSGRNCVSTKLSVSTPGIAFSRVCEELPGLENGCRL